MALSPVQLTQLQVFCERMARSSQLGIVLKKSTGEVLAGAAQEAGEQPASRQSDLPLNDREIITLVASGDAGQLAGCFDVVQAALLGELESFKAQTRVERYEAFLDAAADWFWESDQDHRFIYLSGKVQEVLGVPAEEILGRTRRELHGAREDLDTPAWQEHFAKVARHHPFSDFELLWERPDGDKRYIVLSGRPYFMADGQFGGYRGTGLDVTEKKRAQIDFENLVEGSIQGICIHRNWQFLFVNSAVARMMGYDSAGEFLKMGSVEKVVAPYELERLRGYGLAREKGEHVEGRHTADYVTKDGRILTLESINSIIEWHGKNAILSTVVDVTERKWAEERLQRHRDHLQELVEARTAELVKSEQRFRDIAETASDWFWQTDSKHHFTFISDLFFEVSGIVPEDVIGKSRLEFVKAQRVYADEREKWVQHQNDLENHRPFSIRYWVHGKEGQEICIEIKGKPLFDADDEFQGYIGAGTDVTKAVQTEEALRVAVEEAENANKAKSDFLSGMSHELRTPLNAILGFAQLLEQNTAQNLTERQITQLTHIRQGGEHLLELVNEILDLAKIEAGKLSISLEDFDVLSIVEMCLPYAEAFADKYDVSIENRMPEGLPSVRADALRTKQAILNLLSNAAKYNKPGGKIWLEANVTQEGMLRLTVRDNGIGIAAKDRIKIFKPFQRAVGTEQMVEGTGIGLVLTQKIIEEMSGHIDFVSQPGEGSTFWLDFPLAQNAEDEAPVLPPQKEKSMAICAPHHQFTMLYVEDNPSNLALMEGIVDCIPNLSMIAAKTAEDGEGLARKLSPDLILMDINLPGMSGMDAVKRLRTFDEMKNVPIFAISADAMPMTVEQGMTSGFDRYLTKPINLSQFLSALEDVLK